MPEPMMEKTPLETLAEDFEGAPPEEAMDNLRLLLQTLVPIDNATEVRLERLEQRLGLPDIEDEPEDAEWEPLPDLETLLDAVPLLERIREFLAQADGGAELATELQTLIDALSSEEAS